MLAGCSKSNADAVAQKSVDTLKELTRAVEKGDKAEMKAVAQKLQNIIKEGNEIKVTKNEKDRMTEKYKPLIEAESKKMMAAMIKSMSEGKITAVDMQEIAKMMQSTK